MAQTLGTLATNFTAVPQTVNAGGIIGGKRLCLLETTEVPDTANADTLILGPLPVDCRLIGLRAAIDDLGTAGTVDIGFFKRDKGAATFTVVDADAIANNIDVNAAAVALTEYRFSIWDINSVNKKLWELANLSARPDYNELFIGITTDTGTTAAGTFSLICDYVVEN
jgi:hypothetical protein